MEFEILILSSDDNTEEQSYELQDRLRNMQNHKTLRCKSNQNLLQFFLANKINIDHSCGGNATCGTCRIQIIKGELSPINTEEFELSSDRDFQINERLSCQSKPRSDLIIRIPSSNKLT